MELRLKRGLLGRLYLQKKVIRNHCRDLNGSGYYDEWQTEHWVKAGFEDARNLDLTIVD